MKKLLAILLLTWSSAFATNRIANSTDAATLPNVNVGDYIVDQANGNPDVFIAGRGVITITYPAKIVISADVVTSLGNKYGGITLNLYDCAGYDTVSHFLYITYYTQSNHPLTYKNYIRLYRASANIKVIVTGEYDAGNKLGNSQFKGRSFNWPWIIGSCGIQRDPAWLDQNPVATIIDSGGVSVTFKDIEFRKGGFAPISINGTNNSVDFYQIRYTRCIVYDVGGEGAYIGNTSGDPQRSLIGLEVDDCIIFLAANEGMQFTRLYWNVRIHNNVIINGSAFWRNAFQEDQDHGAQITVTGSNVWFYNNLLMGGAQMALQISYLKDANKTPGGDTVKCYNNAFIGSWGPKAIYSGASSYGPKCPLKIDNNFFGKFALPYNYNLTVTSKPNTQRIIELAFDTPIVIRARNNIFDLTKTTFITATGSPGVALTDTGNNRAGAVPWPHFGNFFGYTWVGPDTVHIRQMEIFADTVGQAWSGATSDSINHPTKYWPGWYVCDSGRWYVTKDTVRGTIQPGVTSGWQTYYSRVYWNMSTVKIVLDPGDLTGLSADPPLDVRLVVGDQYAALGIGLTEQVSVISRAVKLKFVNGP